MRGRNVINILILSLIFIIIFFVFIVLVFVPAGKHYKKEYKVYTKQMHKLRIAQDKHDETMDHLQELQAKNRNIVSSFENIFDDMVFKNNYHHYFQSLQLEKVIDKGKDGIFYQYEVKTSALLRSPAQFYEFLEMLNKGDNIIHVQFPINFKSKKGQVTARFKMKILAADYEKHLKLVDSNTTVKQKGSNL